MVICSDLLSQPFLLPFAVLVAQATLIFFTGNGFAISMLIGQLANEALNAVLKRVFAAPRPNVTDRTDFGMPSSHAQFIVFSFVFAVLLVRYENTHPRVTPLKML